MISIRSIPWRRAAVGLVLTLVLAACDWRGPEPTEAVLMASSGPYAVGSVAVPSSAGFGGGTLYYPANTSEGPFAVISISPGFLSAQDAIAPWGPRLASHGFVAITINTTNSFIQPEQRSTEQRQALDYVVNQGNTQGSPVFGKVDGTRQGVAGHSMGGGGSLISLRDDPDVDVAVPLAPWNGSSSFSTVNKPALVIACQNDAVAAVASHASPMYNSLAGEKQYISLAGGDHFCANSPAFGSGLPGKYAVAFFKRWLDGDTRYDPWTCGASRPVAGGTLNEVRSTCPF
ncbi:MAG TPA: alpha/beta hydrolase [Acidimicrobiales bacterium]|nr:alpha/beta hydrolase [Acidimicrobiales bacterium]